MISVKQSSVMIESLLPWLQGLREHADDAAFQEKWQEVKQTAKSKAVARIAHLTGTDIPAHALLDIQVGSQPLHCKVVHERSRCTDVCWNCQRDCCKACIDRASHRCPPFVRISQSMRNHARLESTAVVIGS